MECTVLPKILYKFSSSSSESFLKREIFFNDPYEFNDPFDMKIRRKVELLPKEDLVLQNVYRLNKEIPDQSFQTLWNIAEDDYEKKMANNPKHYKDMSLNAQKKEREINLKKVLCLSEKNDDILMWAHYGDSNKGICIGYNSERLCQFLKDKYWNNTLGIFQVEYSSNYPDILPTIGNSIEKVRKRIAFKSLVWSYEREWRLVFYYPNSIPIPINEEIVEEIILGSNVQPETEKEILKIQRDKYPHAQVFKVVPDDSEFKLNVLPYNPSYSISSGGFL